MTSPTSRNAASRPTRSVLAVLAPIAVWLCVTTQSGGSASASVPVVGAVLDEPTTDGTASGNALDAGGTATPFAIRLPAAAACSGDATAGYRIQSFIVPASVDPTTLTFNATGPVPIGNGADLRRPLYAATGSAGFVNKSPSADSGLIVGLVPFSFAVFGAQAVTVVPPGQYRLGVACTTDSGATMDRLWEAQIDVVADANDPGGFTWSPSAVEPTTTTSTTSSTTTSTTPGSSTTSTTTEPDIASSTTTTTDGGEATTTTVDPCFVVDATTGSTVDPCGTTTTLGGFGPIVTTTTAPVVFPNVLLNPPGGIAQVGSPWVGPGLFWAFLILAFGRIVVLLARRVPVVSSD